MRHWSRLPVTLLVFLLLLTQPWAVVNFAALQDNLTACWDLEEASGTRDDAIGANNLTDTNTVTQTTGQISNAAVFVRANSETLIAADHADLSTGNAVNFTIATWIYLANKTNTFSFVAKWAVDSASSQEYILWYDNSTDRHRCTVRLASTGVITADATTFGSPPTSTWHFVVCTYTDDGASTNTVSIAVNGGARNTATGASQLTDTTEELWLGGNENSTNRYLDGRMDVTAFFKRAITEGEEDTIYNGSVGMDCTTLAAGGAVASGGYSILNGIFGR